MIQKLTQNCPSAEEFSHKINPGLIRGSVDEFYPHPSPRPPLAPFCFYLNMPPVELPPPTPSKSQTATLDLLKTVNFEHTAHADAQLGILSPDKTKMLQQKARGSYGHGQRSTKQETSRSFRPDSSNSMISDSTFADWKEDPFFSEVLDTIADEEYSKKMEDEFGEPLDFPETLGDDDIESKTSTINPPAVAAPLQLQAPPPPVDLTEEEASKTLKSQVARRKRLEKMQRPTKSQTLSLLQFAAGSSSDLAAQLPAASTKAFHSRKLGR